MVAAGVVLLGTGLGACGSSGGSPGAASTVRADVPADARTQQIAEVEFARQCSVGTQSFPKEADIDADLAKRLATAGVSHLEWKQWHDSLAVSPQLVTQFAEVGKHGCQKT
ncbi:hypothetical protein GCM10009868_02780 [Terrabacter aerolatus]|uniref:Uncharacterized protein n=1 Tax=Terrabacter aerolatus TaxID=422442 RepID=A0A512D2B2_9MICO|nr:hypothetical protein TAE01_24150 [Terrabacter aerolatus]